MVLKGLITTDGNAFGIQSVVNRAGNDLERNAVELPVVTRHAEMEYVMSRFFEQPRRFGELYLSRRVDAVDVHSALSDLVSVSPNLVYVQDYEDRFGPEREVAAFAVLIDIPGGEFPVRADIVARDQPWNLDVAREMAASLDIDVVTYDEPMDVLYLVRPGSEPTPIEVDRNAFRDDRIVLTPESRARVSRIESDAALTHA